MRQEVGRLRILRGRAQEQAGAAIRPPMDVVQLAARLCVEVLCVLVVVGSVGEIAR
jgi:hypothetical protein